MTIEQLHSLNEDELAILWFCINKTNPPTLPYEMEPAEFLAINHVRLTNRLMQCRQYIKPEYHSIFDELVAKLKV